MTNKTKISIDFQKELINKFILIMNIIVSVIGLLLLVLGVFIKNYINIIFSVVLVAFFWLFYEKMILKSIQKKTNIFKEEHYYFFEFFENNFTVRLESIDSVKAETNITYEEIIKIKETKKMIVFFITKNMAYFLDKKGMIESNLEDLTKLLKSKVNIYQVVK